MLCAAIMTDHWEHVTWDRTNLDRISNDTSTQLEWFLDGRVARIIPKAKTKLLPPSDYHLTAKLGEFERRFGDRQSVYLVPMHGGIWTLCIDLTDDEIRQVSTGDGFPRTSQQQCVNYLAGNMESAKGLEEERSDWQHSEFQASLHPHLSRYNRL
jgi:hypothetical protein